MRLTNKHTNKKTLVIIIAFILVLTCIIGIYLYKTNKSEKRAITKTEQKSIAKKKSNKSPKIINKDKEANSNKEKESSTSAPASNEQVSEPTIYLEAQNLPGGDSPNIKSVYIYEDSIYIVGCFRQGDSEEDLFSENATNLPITETKEWEFKFDNNTKFGGAGGANPGVKWMNQEEGIRLLLAQSGLGCILEVQGNKLISIVECS